VKNGNDAVGFFVGLIMTCVGGYLFMRNVDVYAANIFTFRMFGRSMDGMIFIPLIASIIFLFYKYNWVSKLCCVVSLMLIIANVLMNLRITWVGTNLFATLVIFVLLFGGIGLLMKTLFANPDGKHGKNYRD